MSHGDFTSFVTGARTFHLDPPRDVPAGWTREVAFRGYQLVCTAVLDFFAAKLRNDNSGQQRLAKDLSDAIIASSAFKPGAPLASVCLLFDIPASPFFRTNHTQLCAERGDQVTLTATEPPAGLTLALAGLWWDAKGDWTRAHESAQQDEGVEGSWVQVCLSISFLGC